MSELFISYARNETPIARQFARALEESGFSVFWDRQIQVGFSWASVIEERLDEARCVIVLWSATSIEDQWVIEEASYARELDKLISVVIGDVKLPIGFRAFHSFVLTDWNGESSHPEFKRLVAAILEKLNY